MGLDRVVHPPASCHGVAQDSVSLTLFPPFSGARSAKGSSRIDAVYQISQRVFGPLEQAKQDWFDTDDGDPWFNAFEALRYAEQLMGEADSGIRPTTFVIYKFMMKNCWRRGDRFCKPLTFLMKWLRLSKDTILDHIRRLERAGLLTIISRREMVDGKSRVAANGYVLHNRLGTPITPPTPDTWGSGFEGDRTIPPDEAAVPLSDVWLDVQAPFDRASIAARADQLRQQEAANDARGSRVVPASADTDVVVPADADLPRQVSDDATPEEMEAYTAWMSACLKGDDVSAVQPPSLLPTAERARSESSSSATKYKQLLSYKVARGPKAEFDSATRERKWGFRSAGKESEELETALARLKVGMQKEEKEKKAREAEGHAVSSPLAATAETGTPIRSNPALEHGGTTQLQCSLRDRSLALMGQAWEGEGAPCSEPDWAATPGGAMTEPER